MSNGPFDRVLLNTREKVLSPDWNAEFSQQDRSILDTLAQLSTRRTSAANSFGLVSDGFIGDGFSVHATSPASLNVIVSAGLAFVANPYAIGDRTNISGISGVNALSALVPVYLSAAQTFTVPTAPSAGNARIDIIEVRADHLVGGATSRQVLDPTTGAFIATSVNKLLSWDVFGRIGYVAAGGSSTEPLSYKQGTAATAGTEVEPGTTSGYIKIAAIRVAASVTTIEENKILDYRPLYAPYGQMTVNCEAIFYVNGSQSIAIGGVSAPPGVEVSITSTTLATTADLRLWVKMGDAYRWRVSSVQASVSGIDGVATSTGQPQTVVDSFATFQLPNSPLGLAAQALLGAGTGGWASPYMQMAIGQTYAYADLSVGLLQQQGATNIKFNPDSTLTGMPTSAMPGTIHFTLNLVRIA